MVSLYLLSFSLKAFVSSSYWSRSRAGPKLGLGVMDLRPEGRFGFFVGRRPRAGRGVRRSR